MPVTRSRTMADVRREIESAEQRYRALFERWLAIGTSASLPADGVTGDSADQVEEVLRLQRGALDRLWALWTEYARLRGLHAPQ